MWLEKDPRHVTRWEIYKNHDTEYWCFTGENSISLYWCVVTKLETWTGGYTPNYDTRTRSGREWFDTAAECSERWKFIHENIHAFMVLRTL